MQQDKFEAYLKLARSTVYSEPEDGNFHNELIAQAVSAFIPLFGLSPTSFVLDAGCGPGVFMDEMRRAGFQSLWGVTLSEDDVAACRAKKHGVTHGDISDLDDPDGTVDLVWCRHAIEHSPYPLFTLYEFNRVLKDGGGLYVEVPGPGLPRAHEWNPNHYSILGPHMWVALMQRAGFEVFDTKEITLELTQAEQKVPELFYAFMARKCRSIVNPS
jgi:SAM-dependent methyltransferase